MYLSEDVLLAVATLCVALIGFSGVVTALGRRGEGKWSASETLQLRTLVEPAVITLYGAFLPIVFNLTIENADLTWRLSNALLLAGHILGMSLFLIRGAKTQIYLSHKIMTGVSTSVLLYQLVCALNLVPNNQFAFALGLLLGVGVSVHNFYLLLFVRQESSEH
jgi:hypothetical protein